MGLRWAGGDDGGAEGQPANLEIIALDGDGKRIAAKGLRWELLRENAQYSWYSVSGAWRHRVTVRDQPPDTGKLDIAADGLATLARTLPEGRYRWQAVDG